MLISDQGTLVRTRVSEVSIQGRDTQGVMLIRLAKDEHLVGVERIAELEDAIDVEELEAEVIGEESASAAPSEAPDDAADSGADSDQEES